MSSGMLNVPIFRLGQTEPYESKEQKPIKDIEGNHLGFYDLTLPVLIRRDGKPENVRPILDRVREVGLLEMCKRLGEAAEIFRTGTLDIGGLLLNPEDFCRLQSRATGVPEAACHKNITKVWRAMTNVEETLRGHLKSWNPKLKLEDLFEGKESPGVARQSDMIGGIMPSNTGAVYLLLAPALALGPVLVKPGSGEIFTPLRLRAACEQAGLPVEAIGIYPGDGEDLAPAIGQVARRRLVFGNEDVVKQFAGDPEVEVHGPGRSKIIVGPDMAKRWREFIPLMAESVSDNSGRGCISCSAIYAPGSCARKIAEALAEELDKITVLPLDHKDALLAAFGSPKAAGAQLELMKKFVEHGKGSFITPFADRAVVVNDKYSFVRPTVAYMPSVPPPGELSASRFEIPAPAVLVVNSDNAPIHEIIGQTLVCTVLTEDAEFLQNLDENAHISRLNRKPIPTTQLHQKGEKPKPIEGVGIPRFLFDADAGKPPSEF